jgi:CubicO group peptidase (beta-lactamase class C family)
MNFNTRVDQIAQLYELLSSLELRTLNKCSGKLFMFLRSLSKVLFLPLSLTLLTLLPISAIAQNLRTDDLTLLDELVPSLMLKNNIPGVAISIVRTSGESIAKSYGVLNAELDDPVTNTSIFEAASTSKPMFAQVVMTLVEQNVLTLDQPLSDYIEFETIANDERSELITARMVLTHSSGLPNAVPRGESPSIMFEPGTQYQYSGWGFRYLQNVVEELTQKR